MRSERLLACRFRSSASNPSVPASTWVPSVSYLTAAVPVDERADEWNAGVFGLLQIVAFAELVRSHVSSKQFQTLLYASVIGMGLTGALAIVGLTYKGWIAPWTGRFYSLWDTGYAKK